MHPNFPLEFVCSHRQAQKHQHFVNRAMDFLGHLRDVALESRSEGLVVMAETEPTLERPLQALREVYGEDVEIGPVRVRYLQRQVLEEPVMGVRVLFPSRFYDAVKTDLEKRGATIVDAEQNPLIGIVRASAPLTRLMGYPRTVAELTQGQAREVMWLSHYAPAASPGTPSETR